MLLKRDYWEERTGSTKNDPLHFLALNLRRYKAVGAFSIDVFIETDCFAVDGEGNNRHSIISE